MTNQKAMEALMSIEGYEDASLGYTGINKHEGEEVGLYDTVLSSQEYQGTFEKVATAR